MKLSQSAIQWINSMRKELNSCIRELGEINNAEEELLQDRKNFDDIINDDLTTLKELGSKFHEIESKIEQLKILTGDQIYANEILWSDINPYEVIEIKSDKTMVIRSMKATIKKDAQEALSKSFVPGGFCGHVDNYHQDWDYESNPNGNILTIRKHKDDGWYNGSIKFSIASKPYKYYDYNF